MILTRGMQQTTFILPVRYHPRIHQSFVCPASHTSTPLVFHLYPQASGDIFRRIHSFAH